MKEAERNYFLVSSRLLMYKEYLLQVNNKDLFLPAQPKNVGLVMKTISM